MITTFDKILGGQTFQVRGGPLTNYTDEGECSSYWIKISETQATYRGFSGNNYELTTNFLPESKVIPNRRFK